MKRKIISTLFALVLVLSFSLVTAVPVMAVTPTISYATYDHDTDSLVLTGSNFDVDRFIDATLLTITGEGGAGAAYTLTAATADVEPDSATTATIVLGGADIAQVEALLNKDGTSAIDGETYNLAAAADWHTTAGGIVIATIAITVSNAPVPDIASATYDHADGNLVLTGTNFYTDGEIDASTLTITGEGAGGASYTLTAATANVTPTSATEATIVVAGTDKTEVEALLNKDGATSIGGTTYNLAAAAVWHGDIGESAIATVGITVNNADAPVILSATYDFANNLVLTGANFDIGTIYATTLTITGEGGAGASYTLTSDTSDVTPGSATTATIVLGGADIAAVEALLNKNGATAIDGTTYNLAAAAGWNGGTGEIAIATIAITVSGAGVPVILSATYDHADNLVLTGTGFETLVDIDHTTLTITGEGGAGAAYTLTSDTTVVKPGSATTATIVLGGADVAGVEALLNKNGLTAIDGETYNLAAAADWHDTAGGIAITTIAITVSNAPVLNITSATYDHTTGNLVLTGTNFYTGGEIDASTLTITGDGSASYTLTALTANVTPTSATEATIVVAGTDKTEVDALLNKDDTESIGGTTYNLAAAAGWHGDIGESTIATVAITVSNAPPVILSAAYAHDTDSLVLTGLHFDVARYIDATALTITGEGAATYTLTAATDDVQPTNATTATFTVAGADIARVAALLNKNGATAIDGETYNLAAAAGWHSAAGGAEITTIAITVSVAPPVILSATYDHADNLVLTGENFNTGEIIDASALTITGEGGATYTLTADTANVTPTSATEATIVLGGDDVAGVEALLNKDGLTSIDGITYNLAAAADWHGDIGESEITTVGITVSNAPVPDIASATYDHDTGNLVLTGTYFYTGGEIGATTLTITGEGAGGASYTLTAATANVTPASATEATIVVAGTDKTEVDALLNKDDTTAVDGTTYNLAAAAGWHGDIGESAIATVAITVSNAPVYDTLLTLNDGWTLFSTDDYIISSAANTSAWVGTPTLIYSYNGVAYVEYGDDPDSAFAVLKPVEALYVKMPGGGFVGLNYSDVVPFPSSKSLVEGWNLVSSANESDAAAVFSPLRYVLIDGQQAIGLSTIVAQGSYNTIGLSNFNEPALTDVHWTALESITLKPFDGYWVYMYADTTFSVIPD